MAVYTKTLKVDPQTARSMEEICQLPFPDTKKDAPEFDEEVVFEDGMRVAVQVIGPTDPEFETAWTQGVLFTPDGTELDCTDCGDSFLGEYHLQDPSTDNEYVVFVEWDDK